MSLPTIAHSACTASQILSPVIFGAEILNINANLVQNYSAYVHEYYYMNHADVNVTNVSFCNVTVTYTHPGQNDTINAEIWLPTDTWNGRMMGVGGSGWISGRSFLPYQEMTGAIGEGYMAMTNDAGLGTASDPLKWGMVSPGNVNMYLLQDLASVSLNDTAYIAKQVSNSLYGQPPNYSYWSGCSQGGRQGMMLAQKYPDAYDGIVASAPAINWAEFITADFWPQLVMNSLGQYPRNCETAAIVAAAIAACDPLDGLTDNVISDPDACNFDPFSMVNSTINCTDTGTTIQISSAAATVVNATWAGVHSQDGSFLWYGPMKGADLTGGVDTIADTSCTSNGTCVSSPNALVSQWIQVFLKRQLEFDVSKITAEDFDRLFHMSVRDFTSIVGTNDPDLSDFRARGGKLLSYHGLNDRIIPPGGSRNYYDRVTALDANVHDFFRLFESPGLGHCYTGYGALPTGIFDSMVAWVENGTVPDNLTGYRPADTNGARAQRLLCPYPAKAVYTGSGDVDLAESYSCSG